MPIFANVIQNAFSPLISLFESIMVFIHAHLVGGSWGLAIVGLTVLIRAVLVPLTLQAAEVDAGDAAAGAADERAQREVQGRQTAPAAGDHELLPGEQNQPARLLPAAAAAAAGLHLAVLHAADGPEEAHLRPAAAQRLQRTARPTGPHMRSKLPSSSRKNRPATGRAALGEVPVHARTSRPRRPASCWWC